MKKDEERFDAVGTMRRIRDRMSREMHGMSYEEQKRRLSGVSRKEREGSSSAIEESVEQRSGR